MIRILSAVSLLVVLSACGDGQPFTFDDSTASDEQTTDEAANADDDELGVDGDRTLPPGTNAPSSNDSIYRTEALNENGGGYVTEVTYNAANDTFFVDNIADWPKIPTAGNICGFKSSIDDGRVACASADMTG